MRVRAWMWAAWAVASATVFGVLETIAVSNNEPNDTLTRTIVEGVPWAIAFGLFSTGVLAAFWHWWTAYHRGDGRLPPPGSDGARCSCSLYGSCHCEGKEPDETCWCIKDRCSCTKENWSH